MSEGQDNFVVEKVKDGLEKVKQVQICTKYHSAKWALTYILFFYAMFFTQGWYVAKWANQTADLVVHETFAAL